MFNLISLIYTILLSSINVIPGGENVGLKINANGVLVIGSYDIVNENITYNPSEDSNILCGDLIYQVEGKNVENIEDLLDCVKQYYTDESATLSILRNNTKLERELKFIKVSNANTIKTGLLVKDKILGIGTMTFYDPNSKVFGALGHKLIDSDFSKIVDINSGNIFNSTVTGINKSSFNNVGEILATIQQDKSIGTICSNTEYGVFGYYDYCPDKQSLEVLQHDKIKLGKAYIMTTLDDNKVDLYEIEITSLKKQESIDTKGISFKIKDKRLLEKTGGIVQGMSGSPIIQDNKLIGAVTHVLVDSVRKGYGIYMDTMIKVAQQNTQITQ